MKKEEKWGNIEIRGMSQVWAGIVEIGWNTREWWRSWVLEKKCED